MKSKESVDYYIKSIAKLAQVQYEIQWDDSTEKLDGTVTFKRGSYTCDFNLEVMIDCSAMFNADTCLANQIIEILYPELEP